MKTVSLALPMLILSLGLTSLAHAEDINKDKHAHMKEVDTNNDGKISFEEFKAQHEKHMTERFKKIDTNADGFLDDAERKAAHEKMRAWRKEHQSK